MTDDDLPLLNADRPVLGRLNPNIREIRSRGPVVKVRTEAGDEAWFVTRYAEMKKLLMDERLGNSHPDPANRPRYLDNPMLDMAITDDPPEIAREMKATVRAILTPFFAKRRMDALQARVAELTERLLDRIVAMEPPVDLHNELSMPLSFQILCELLGIADSETFMSLLATAGRVSKDTTIDSAETLFGYLTELAAAKRADPKDDMISKMATPELPDDDVVAMLVVLTSFSFLVTPSNLSAGIGLFAVNPDQRDRVVQDPGLLDRAVEEVVRLGKLHDSFVPRYANAEIEIGGVAIQPGDLVLCDHYAANYDDRVFEDPERFHITRSPNPHVGFSHGFSHCIGAPLARLELREVIGAVLRRLPTLGLAVPVEDISLFGGDGGDTVLGGGIARLPVTW
jgi:cytochrome P450 monooxygenase